MSSTGDDRPLGRGRGPGDGSATSLHLSLVDVLTRLCRAAAQEVPATGAGVSVCNADGALLLAAVSDDDSVAIEQIQFTVGEGPCFEAFATRRPALAPDLSAEAVGRWTAYTPAAHAAGVRAVFAFPLQIGHERLGVLDVYRDRPGNLSQAEMAQALAFAELAVDMLLDGQATVAEGEPASGLGTVVDRSAEIYQAQGMVKVMLGVDLAEAMVRLRAHAWANDMTLTDVAREIVARRMVLSRDY